MRLEMTVEVRYQFGMRALSLLLLLPSLVLAEEVLPAGYPASRYAVMLEQSPFALATVVEAPKGPTESFAANWELTGLARLRDDRGDERDFVTVRSRDRRLSFSLFGEAPSNDEGSEGVSLVSVDRDEEARKSSVILRKGTETAKVEFGQESAPAMVPPPASNGRPNMGRAGMPPPPTVVPSTGVVPANGVNPIQPNRPMIQTRPNLPANINVPSVPVTGMGGNMGNGAQPQPTPPRRVRVINSR